MQTIKNFLIRYNLPLRYLLVITTIASGYISAISYVQLGIPNFGRITLGLDDNFVNQTILFFALIGGLFAYLGGKFLLHRVRNNIHAIILLRGFFILATIGGRSLSAWVDSAPGYLGWVLLMGMIMGLSTAFSYVLIYLLLPPRNRGVVGGIITAITFGVTAISLPDSWTMDAFLHDAPILTIVTYTGYALLLIFVLGRPVSQKVVDENIGNRPYRNYNFRNIFIVLTLVLFVDSFGFIRIVMGTKDFSAITWHGNFSMLAYIGIVHVISALFFGYLYSRKSPVFLLRIALILFFGADLLFVVFYGIPQFQMFLAYAFVLFYASAVSIYTIVYITLIADVVTRENMGQRYGLYTGIVGWVASFISTGIALAMVNVIPVKVHITIAGLLSLAALGLLSCWFRQGEPG